jgi:pyruvate/2-oxoglutarate dehydrogenase complex dihydrolipoamide dehydrogenase (E3) component
MFGRSRKVLQKEDDDLAEIVRRQMADDGVQFRLDVAGFSSLDLTGQVSDNGFPELAMKVRYGEDQNILKSKCDVLLLTTGRKPNVTGMDLELANVKYDGKTGLVMNDNLQTTNPRIYVVGDCCTDLKYTHTADFMARMVVRSALFLGNEKMSSLLIPYATYTTPEVAHVGLHARDLKERDIPYRTIEKPLAENDRAITDRDTCGLVCVWRSGRTRSWA